MSYEFCDNLDKSGRCGYKKPQSKDVRFRTLILYEEERLFYFGLERPDSKQTNSLEVL